MASLARVWANNIVTGAANSEPLEDINVTWHGGAEEEEVLRQLSFATLAQLPYWIIVCPGNRDGVPINK